MKIILLGHHDLPSNLALSLLVAGLPEHSIRIYLSGTVASDANLPQALHEMASVDRGYCDALQHARIPGVMDFAGLAEATGHPVQDLAEPNSVAGLARVRDFAPDLIVSVRYRRILRDEVIALPRLGVLNLHSGLLPDYQGVMATFWAMLNGSPEIGSTVHYIEDAGIDTGSIVCTQPQRPMYDKSYLSNVLSLYPSGCAAMLESINTLAAGRRLAARAKIMGGKYYGFPEARDISNFLESGLALVTGNELDELKMRTANPVQYSESDL